MGTKRENLLWALLCPVIYMVVLWNMVPFVYGIVDDRTMMEVVSGQYLGTPDGHTIFIGYWYSCFLACLYRLAPGVDWYASGFLALQGICMSLVLFRLLKRQDERLKRLWISVAALLGFLVLGMRTVTQVTFTTTAAVLAVTALFWYVTSECFGLRELLVLLLLCFLTVEARFTVYCMILPVCGVFWLFRLWKDIKQKRTDRGHLLVPLMAAGAMVLHLAGSFAGYGSEDWKAYNDYNDVCTIIYDYGDYVFPRYEDDTELYNQAGIWSKVRAKNLYYYNYTADDEITMDFFGKYLDLRKAMVKEQRNPVRRLLASIRDYVKNTVKGLYDYGHLLALAGYGLLILRYGQKKEWGFCLKACCVLGVQWALWIYLIYRGRVPLRVQICMNLMLIVSLLLLWKEQLAELKIPAKVFRTGACAACALLFVFACWRGRMVRQENLEMSRQNEDVEALKEYCTAHPENFYFSDVVSLAMSSYNVHLWLEEPYGMNYIPLGDWISFSPVWAEKLQRNGITSVPDALYGQDHVYLISSFDRGVEYLTDLYENVRCEEVDKIACFRIYQLRR